MSARPTSHADVELALRRHQTELSACRRCPRMQGTPVTGQAVVSPVMLVGQAPGIHEQEIGRPFAWTAGRTLFRWFSGIGLDEQALRERVYMTAVCRCFPGRNPRGGDRVPDRGEVAECDRWLRREITLLRPRLILPVGRLAIGRFLEADRLDQVIGLSHRIEIAGRACELIPLPHPSGASTWHRTEPGRTLLARALGLLEAHPAWRALLPA